MNDEQRPYKRKSRWKQWLGVALVSCVVSTAATVAVMTTFITSANVRADISNKALKAIYWEFCIERARQYQNDAKAKKACEDIWTGTLAANTETGAFVSPLKMAKIVEIESHFNPTAVSSATAFGLAQIHIPAHGRYPRGCDILDTVCNIKTGAILYSEALTAFGGDERLASYAYNRGIANVKASLRKGEYPGKGDYARKVMVL